MSEELEDAKWNLDTFLELHYLLLHRSAKKRGEAIRALLDIATRNPVPLTITPIDFLREVIVPFTYGSGGEVLVFYELTQENTLAADEALREILRVSPKARNESFKKFIEIAIAEGKSDLLKVLENAKLSQTKTTILRQATQQEQNEKGFTPK
jgi:hypothetical protein